MQIAVILMTALLQLLCKGQEVCEIFHAKKFVPYGSDVMMFLKAPSNSNCRSKTPFSPSRIFWTLNKRKIDKMFYDFNSSFVSVFIRNLSVESGTVECFLNATPPVLLDGTFIQTYPRISSPQNVSCFAKICSSLKKTWPKVTCKWDHDRYTTDIKYKVHLKQNKENTCESGGKNCTFPDDVNVLTLRSLSISVSAQDAYENSAHSNEVTYSNVWNIVQMDSPEDVIAEPLPTGLRVTWKTDPKNCTNLNDTECEIRVYEKGSYTEPVEIIRDCSGTEDVPVVKPCTNYTVSVRSRYKESQFWSTWSQDVTALSYLNVSSLRFHLWRLKSVSGDRGKRTVLLMWKGIPASCKAFDEYRVFRDSAILLERIGPYQNHMFIHLDEHPHNITVAVFRNEAKLNEASIEVPAMAEEAKLPPVGNISVFVQHGGIHITWGKPSLPVSGYIIVWNSTAKNHMWQQTQETSFTLKGEPSTVYTISLTPLYNDGPGNEITLRNCSQDRNLTKVSKVQEAGVTDKLAEIHWLPILPTQSCAFVLNYTVFYAAYKESKPRNVTVGPNQHHVILKDLQARTTYSVYVTASTLAASSESSTIVFSTGPNSQGVLIVIIVCCFGLILLPMLAVMIQRKLLNKKIPDPRFSSLSVWPSDNCRKPWSLFSVPGDRDTDKILPCHVDSEGVSVSAQSNNDMATVKALTDIRNIATQETTSQTENAPLAASFSNKGQLAFGGKEQRNPHVLSLDLQNSGICPLPPIQSPYRKQTPLCSPVESPTKPLWSDETEALLTPKLKNATYFTSYVTLDVFEPGKHQTK